MMSSNNCKHTCGKAKFAWVLVIIGGINWGLVGLGMLVGSDLNVVSMLLSQWPTVLAIVYLLVGVATIIKLFGCPCKKCKEACKECMVSAPAEAPKM